MRTNDVDTNFRQTHYSIFITCWFVHGKNIQCRSLIPFLGARGDATDGEGLMLKLIEYLDLEAVEASHGSFRRGTRT